MHRSCLLYWQHDKLTEVSIIFRTWNIQSLLITGTQHSTALWGLHYTLYIIRNEVLRGNTATMSSQGFPSRCTLSSRIYHTRRKGNVHLFLSLVVPLGDLDECRNMGLTFYLINSVSSYSWERKVVRKELVNCSVWASGHAMSFGNKMSSLDFLLLDTQDQIQK